VHTGKYSSLYLESIGNKTADHDSGASSKKITDLITNLKSGPRNGEDEDGDENVIEEDDN
jgi:hypothetical protein